jgi:NAD(P)-dependent dehydrogenase (short-subunit alcohol dehydrogenase family)
VRTSGFGAVSYMHGPAYGAVKAGVDKLAHDMAVDFRPCRVTVVSIWMGLLRDVDGTQPGSRRPLLGGPPAYHPAVVR